MAYRRVIPRDLFNEADLLKCLGRLCILLENHQGHRAELSEGDGAPFDIQQDESSGALEVRNLPFRIAGNPFRLTRPLNSRRPWPLYAEDEDDAWSVFTSDGELTPEFLDLIKA
jgi:hypothetical protein